MNKRGQFYLIIVLVLSFLIYGITGKTNTIQQPILFEDFFDLSNNYMFESSRMINDALYNREDISSNLEEFTKEFLIYAQQKNPSVGLLYVYNNGSDINITNYLDEFTLVEGTPIGGAQAEVLERVVIDIGGVEFIHQVPLKLEEFGTEWYTSTSTNEKINISIGGILHSFDLAGSGPSFNVILRSKTGEEWIRTMGNIEGEGIQFSPPQNLNIETINVYVEK